MRHRPRVRPPLVWCFAFAATLSAGPAATASEAVIGREGRLLR